ncbi:MAG: hypothetical protein BGO76_08830 [Caedibacter sp. 38-128]|nr:hypothetical protein [Holosporales bacterium]OJX08886.1 MAG: hypothetical protein BGO76_08830 [Caedibacter sp. 38-128]
MKFKLLTFSSLASIIALAGCAEYDLKKAPGYQFTKEQPIHLNVKNFKIINTPVGIETPTTKNLRLSLEDWGNSRFVPYGQDKNAILIVEEAKLLTHQDEYKGKIRVKLELRDEHGFIVGSANAAVNRTLKLPVDLSLEERETQLKRFQQEMINDVDAQMTKQLVQHLPTYISTLMS